MKGFSDILDYQFTSLMEDNLDDIASGKKEYATVMKEFYDKFHPKVIESSKNIIEIKDSMARKLGIDPTTKDEIIATTAKFGPVVKICSVKPKYAPINEPLTLETVTLEDALKLFEYPKLLGKYERKEIYICKGKFGFYLAHGKLKPTRVAIDEPNITLEDAIIKLGELAPLKQFTSPSKVYTVRKGPHGHYVTVTPIITGKGKASKGYTVTIPADTDIEKLELKTILQIIDKKFSKKAEL
jgi:topoisomerase IA-like protein